MKTNNPIKYFTSVMVLMGMMVVGSCLAQDDEKDEKDKRPVRSPFESALLIDGQTIVVPSKGTLEFDIQHRFGTIRNGFSDLFGIYAPSSNIRLGINYTPVDNLSIGFGTTKGDKLQDFNIKYAILKQTRSWTVPVGITYYGNAVIDAGKEDHYDNKVQRLSYYHEVMIATKINSDLTLQLSPSYSHYNGADSLYSNDVIAVSARGRYKITPVFSIISGIEYQLTGHEAIELAPNISFGIELATSGHAFQVFAGNFQEIVPQKNIAFNQNRFGRGEILIGFNITRLWNF